MEDKSVSHSARLRRVREFMGYSQRELARELGVSSGAIASWETGANPVSGPILRLLDLYELNLEIAPAEQTPNWIHSALRPRTDSSDTTARGLPQKSSEELDRLLNNLFNIKVKENPVRAGMLNNFYKNLLESLFDGNGVHLKVAERLSQLDSDLSFCFRKKLIRLQADCVAMTFEQVKECIENELKSPLSKIFSFVDSDPYQVDGFMQIHQARLHSGEAVAIKVQRPHLEKSLMQLRNKFANKASLIRVFSRDQRLAIKHLWENILADLDYEQLAQNQMKVFEIAQSYKDVVIPKVYRKYSTKKVMTSDFAFGKNLKSYLETATEPSKKIVAQNLMNFLINLNLKHHLHLGELNEQSLTFGSEQVILTQFGGLFHTPQPEQNTERDKYSKHRYLIQKNAALLQYLYSGGTTDNEKLRVALKNNMRDLNGSFEPLDLFSIALKTESLEVNQPEVLSDLVKQEKFIDSLSTLNYWNLLLEFTNEANWKDLLEDLLQNLEKKPEKYS